MPTVTAEPIAEKPVLDLRSPSPSSTVSPPVETPVTAALVPIAGAGGVPAPTLPVFAINCGGPAVGGWSADAHFSAGSVSWGVEPGDDPVGNRQRFTHVGNLTYTLPLPTSGGSYRLTLQWKELYYDAPDDRLMRVAVAVDGRPPVTVARALDVVARAGGARRTFTLVYPPHYAPALSASTSVVVSVVGLRGSPFLSTLRLDTSGVGWSTAVNCGGPALSVAAASDGIAYVADTGYSAGSREWRRLRPLLPQHAVLRYAPPGLPGGLVYTLPVPRAGVYLVTLTWVEMFYTAAGRRLMDVYVGADAPAVATAASGLGRGGNALRLVSSGVDVYRRAGNAVDRPVSSDFWVSATSSVTVQLLGRVGGPMLSTLQVMEEGGVAPSAIFQG
ncbi:hypothetical protein MMPV_009912 [Pyropia vietnamensis]